MAEQRIFDLHCGEKPEITKKKKKIAKAVV
jgi:hypothetical protein